MPSERPTTSCSSVLIFVYPCELLGDRHTVDVFSEGRSDAKINDLGIMKRGFDD